jgi:cytosine/adenosine deaminase-related metal-dependent hydrolase
MERDGLGPDVLSVHCNDASSLSVDSIAGCDTADFFSVMRFALLAQRMIHRDVSVYRPDQVLRHATAEGAIAVGLGDVTGTLTPGKKADVILVRADALNMAPIHDPATQVVLCGQPRNVDTVFIDGVCRKRGGELVNVDVKQVVETAGEAVRRLRGLATGVS